MKRLLTYRSTASRSHRTLSKKTWGLSSSFERIQAAVMTVVLQASFRLLITLLSHTADTLLSVRPVSPARPQR